MQSIAQSRKRAYALDDKAGGIENEPPTPPVYPAPGG